MVKKKKLEKPPKKEVVKKTPSLAPKAKKKSTPSQGAASEEPMNSLGKKFSCHSCNAKFYDLNKTEKICPKCGADQNAKPTVKQKTKASKISEYDVSDEEATEIPDELVAEGEELEIDEEVALDEEEV
jgi:Zn finger protein HypA/HybF involved in hydrogenase expression